MSGRHELDQLVTDWLHGEAPPRAPHRLLATALERVGDVGQERPIGLDLGGWSFGSARARWAIIGVVLAVLALGAMVGAGAALFRGTTTSLPGAVNGWVAFTGEGWTRQSESDIWLVRDGVEEFRITGSDSDDLREVCPQFSPDGTRLVYVVGPVGNPAPEGGAAVVIVTLDPSGRPADPEVRIPLESWHQICPKWSPDGQTVAFVDSDTTLWTARVDGTLTRVGGLGPATNGMSQIAFSPDGTAVAATDEQGSGLWIRPLDGSEPRIFQRAEPGVDFTPGPTLEGPRYSADGTRIAVAAHGAAGSSLLVYRLGGEQLPVELEGGDVFAWSPVGHELAYVRGAERTLSEIAVAAFDGAEDRLIAREQRFVRGLVWAPDDSRVVYAADGTLMSVRAAGDSAPIALTRQGHDFEWTTSDDLSWQTVLP